MVPPTHWAKINDEGSASGQVRAQCGPNGGSDPTRTSKAGRSGSPGGCSGAAPADTGAPATQDEQDTDVTTDAAEINADGDKEVGSGGSRAPLKGDTAAGGNGEPDYEQRLLGSRRLYKWSSQSARRGQTTGQIATRDQPTCERTGILGSGSGVNRAVHAAEWENVIEISAEVWGRTYYLRAQSAEDCDKWVEEIQRAKDEADAAYLRSLYPTRMARAKQWARDAYEHPYTQSCITFVLLSNFIVNICETEAMSQLPLPGGNETARRKGVAKGVERDAVAGNIEGGGGSLAGEGLKHPLQQAFDTVDLVYTCIYLLEVLWNLYGHWFWDFFLNSWSCFDLVVVLLSVVEVVLIDLSPTEASGPDVNVLRLLRIFRVLRIIGKMRSMKRITDAIQCSITPVASAMLLSFVVLSIYSILGVNLFAHKYPHADEYFGSYSLAFIGLLGIATGDSWTFEVRAMKVDESASLDWQVGLACRAA